ncbi:MAG: ammonium transporter [Planctomycetales bacterium]|nr:ammonium transporter [Planctomycetales bacterium]
MTIAVLLAVLLTAMPLAAQVSDDGTVLDDEFGFGMVEIEGDSSIGLEPIEPIDAVANVWMLSVACLALLTALPGAALLVASTAPLIDMPRVLAVLGAVAASLVLVWVGYGYSLAYGGNADGENFSPWIGNAQYVLLADARPRFDETSGETRYPTRDGVATLTHATYRGMLFVLAGVLLSTAVVERFSPLAVVLFTVAWASVVGCPLLHWTWNSGVLAHLGGHARIAGVSTGVIDSAGGLPVFFAVGISGLVAMFVTRGRCNATASPAIGNQWGRSFVAFAGTWLFFVGMCGIVGRSNTAGHGQAAVAVMNTILAAAAGCLGWCAVESVRQTLHRAAPPRSGRFLGGTPAGAVVAGIAAIASGAVYLDVPWAMATALAAGLITAIVGSRAAAGRDPWNAAALLAALAIGGLVGVVGTGVFATRNVAGTAAATGRLGVLENGPLLSQHLAALIVVAIYAGIASAVLAKFAQLLSRPPAPPTDGSVDPM